MAGEPGDALVLRSSVGHAFFAALGALLVGVPLTESEDRAAHCVRKLRELDLSRSERATRRSVRRRRRVGAQPCGVARCADLVGVPSPCPQGRRCGGRWLLGLDLWRRPRGIRGVSPSYPAPPPMLNGVAAFVRRSSGFLLVRCGRLVNIDRIPKRGGGCSAWSLGVCALATGPQSRLSCVVYMSPTPIEGRGGQIKVGAARRARRRHPACRTGNLEDMVQARFTPTSQGGREGVACAAPGKTQVGRHVYWEMSSGPWCGRSGGGHRQSPVACRWSFGGRRGGGRRPGGSPPVVGGVVGC